MPPWRDFFIDGTVVAEATVPAADFNQAAKFLVARERPFVHTLAPADKGATSAPADNNISFYSGHASISMALAVSMAEVASLRRYDFAPVAWVTLPALALFTGYLRIAADKHYFTDVATGAATGSNQMLLGAVGSFKGAESRDAAGVPSGRGRLPAEQ